MLLLFYKSFPVIAQYLIYTSLNLTVPCFSIHATTPDKPRDDIENIFRTIVN
ncbi:hypothetical protein [Rickettsia sp. MEAM1 (Bemisia tabaci)]|uniref:hypothetical protein n=1 Tax=Rickettsia sp. MEAM1 (Bemisia tabaci) TaxID=1182263 RepID=UPI0012FE594D|nr:hypothetical protein [Rickettsia sp. MEAM1 (Bemisia tabaci)]